MTELFNDERLRPIHQTGKSFYPYIGALVVIFLWGVYAYYVQLTTGLAVTSMNDITIWGTYIVNFIFFSGISLAGIGIATAVRILHLKDYEPLVRFAELFTVCGLAVAGLSVLIDLGRPDRSYLLIKYYLNRIGTSTMMWDITAVATYFILSATFLYIGMRSDLRYCMKHYSDWKKVLYGILTPLYDPKEKPTARRLSHLLSISILPVMILFHTVLAWIFGVGSTRPLWFGSAAGPYFVSAAVASGTAAILFLAYVLRELYDWAHIIKDKLIRGLGNFLSVSILVYLYFMLSELMTTSYAAPSGETIVSQEWLFGSFAWIFWPMLIFGMIIPTLWFLYQALKPNYVNIEISSFMSLLVIIAFWVKRYIIIIPTLSIGAYEIYLPSWVEISITLGSFALLILVFSLFIKIFPMFELEEEKVE